MSDNHVTTEIAKIISTEHIRHVAGTRGIRVGKIEIVEVAGSIRELRYWYDYSSDSDTPHHISSHMIPYMPEEPSMQTLNTKNIETYPVYSVEACRTTGEWIGAAQPTHIRMTRKAWLALDDGDDTHRDTYEGAGEGTRLIRITWVD
jgi:hypothetical protein